VNTFPAAVQPLRDVRGPSAFSGEWRRFFRLVWKMARTDFSLQHHGSVLGYLWSLMNPLLYFGVLYVAFTQVIKLGAGIDHYAVMLIFNLMLFQFFSEATGRSVSSIVGSEGLIRKMEFPRLAVPMSVISASAISLAFNLIVVVLYAFVNGLEPRWTWLYVPLLVAVVFIFTLGLCLLLSSLYVRFRDIGQVWSVITRALFYMAAVIIPFEFYPQSLRLILGINPLTPVFVQARHWVVDPSAPTFTEIMGNSAMLIPPLLVLVATVGFGFWYFNREAPSIAEDL
jgi:ABC-2 type transport system permease protein